MNQCLYEKREITFDLLILLNQFLYALPLYQRLSIIMLCGKENSNKNNEYKNKRNIHAMTMRISLQTIHMETEIIEITSM